MACSLIFIQRVDYLFNLIFKLIFLWLLGPLTRLCPCVRSFLAEAAYLGVHKSTAPHPKSNKSNTSHSTNPLSSRSTASYIANPFISNPHHSKSHAQSERSRRVIMPHPGVSARNARCLLLNFSAAPPPSPSPTGQSLGPGPAIATCNKNPAL